MNLDLLSFSLVHIENIIGSLTKKNFKLFTQEINQWCHSHPIAPDAQLHLLNCLLTHLARAHTSISHHTSVCATSSQTTPTLSPSSSLIGQLVLSLSNSSNSAGHAHRCTLFRREFASLLTRSNIVRVLVHILSRCKCTIDEFLQFIVLPGNQFSLPDRIAFALALLRISALESLSLISPLLPATPSSLPQLATSAAVHKPSHSVAIETVCFDTTSIEQFTKQSVLVLIKNYIDSGSSPLEEGGLHEVSPEFLHQLLAWVFTTKVDLFDPTENIPKVLLKAIQEDFPRDRVPCVLAPLIYREVTDVLRDKLHSVTMDCDLMEHSLAEYITDIGYTFTASAAECRKHLQTLSKQSPATLGAPSVARALAAMVRTRHAPPSEHGSAAAGSVSTAAHALCHRMQAVSLTEHPSTGSPRTPSSPSTLDSPALTIPASAQQLSPTLSSDTAAVSVSEVASTNECVTTAVSTTTSQPVAVSGSGSGGATCCWNMQVFARALFDTQPSLQWSEVLYYLDHANIAVCDRHALQLFTQAVRCGLLCHGVRMETFSLDYLYRRWSNTESQLMLIEQLVNNPDVFSLSSVCGRPRVDVSMLKIQPDSDNPYVNVWRCTELVQLLLELSQLGHLAVVHRILSSAVKRCPDVLLLALLAVTCDCPHVHDLLSHLITVLLEGEHANCVTAVLHCWQWAASAAVGHTQSQGVRAMVLRTLVEWYTGEVSTASRPLLSDGSPVLHTEQLTRLCHILDIAQELKILSVLLNYDSHVTFTVHLASLAARRGYLKLDNWVAGKCERLGEPFVRACVTFITSSCCHLSPAVSSVVSVCAPAESLTSTPADHCTESQAPVVMTTTLDDSTQTVTAAVCAMPSHTVKAMVTALSVHCPAACTDLISCLRTLAVSLDTPSAVTSPRTSTSGQLADTLPSVAPLPPATTASTVGACSDTGSVPAVTHSLSHSVQPAATLAPDYTRSDPVLPSNDQQSHRMNVSGQLAAAISTVFTAASNICSAAHLNSSGPYTSFLDSIAMTSGANNFSTASDMKQSAMVNKLFTSAQRSASHIAGQSTTDIGAMHAPAHSSTHTPDVSLISGSATALSGNPLTQPPATTAGSSTASAASVLPSGGTPLTGEVEAEANCNFQRIYNLGPLPQLSIDEVLDMLKRFQDSSVQREREVFNCMLRNLMEEYKFFAQYPDKELYITAQLFGGIIEHNLVTSYMSLGFSLRYVLDAVRKPVGSKMYGFGVVALNKFRERLRDYPQYCQHLSSIEHFKHLPKHLIEYVECGARGVEAPASARRAVLTHNFVCSPFAGSVALAAPPYSEPSAVPSVSSAHSSLHVTTAQHCGVTASTYCRASTASTHTTPAVCSASLANYHPFSSITASSVLSVATPGGSAHTMSTPGSDTRHFTTGRPSIANTTNIDTLLHGITCVGSRVCDLQLPSEHVQEKVLFLFNNLSQVNLLQKRDDLLALLDKSHWTWLAQYFVIRRVSIEPNFHTLYANFLECLHMPELFLLVVRELHRNIQVLLRSDKSVEKFNDRTILKNLGHCLGLLTIARNFPILQIDLDLKALIIEAFHLGMHELLYIVPFVAKILESCIKSKIFRPPNPWTLGLMNLFAELHQEEGLKLNLKFEIEVLCKTLVIDINELKPSQLLHDQSRLLRIPVQLRVLQPVVPLATPLPATSLHSQPAQQSQFSLPHSSLPAAATLHTPTHHMQPPPFTHQQQHTGVMGGLMSVLQPTAPQIVSVGPRTCSAPDVTAVALQQQHMAAPEMSLAMMGPSAQARFSLADFSTSSFASITPLIIVNSTLPLFQSNPHLKQMVRPCVERTIQDWLPRAVERNSKLAVNTVECIVKKDFALEPDEMKMRAASHQMVINLSAGLTLINCKDQLFLSTCTSLRAAFLNVLRTPCPTLDQTVTLIVSDNIELICCFLQKTTLERAIHEIDKRLLTEFEIRKLARLEGRRYIDISVLAYQETHLPEPLRLKSMPPRHLVSVYEQFMRTVHSVGAAATPLNAAHTEPVYPDTPAQMPMSSVSRPCTTMPQLYTNSASANQMPSASVPPPPAPPPPQSITSVSVATPLESTADPLTLSTASIFEKIAIELQKVCSSLHTSFAGSAQAQTLARLADDTLMMTRNPRDVNGHIHLIKLAADGLLEYMSQLSPDPELAIKFRDAHLLVLRVLQDPRLFGQQWVQKQIVTFIIEWRDDPRLNVDSIDAFLRARLITVQLLDAQLSHLISAGNMSVVNFSLQLIQAFMIDDNNSLVQDGGFANTIEALIKLSQQSGCPENITHILDIIKPGSSCFAQLPSMFAGPANMPAVTLPVTLSTTPAALCLSSIASVPPPTPVTALSATEATRRGSVTSLSQLGPTSHIHKGIAQARDFSDPPGLKEKTEFLLREWINLYYMPNSGRDSTKAFTTIVNQMNVQGILKTDDLITRFFRLSTYICVDLCYGSLGDPASSATTQSLARTKCFRSLDAFVRLIALLVKHSGESPNAVSKVNLLNKVLGVVTGVLLQDHELRRTEFMQLPYHRIYIMLLLELNAPETILDLMNFQVLTAFCNVLHILRPEKAPGFTYSWVDIISHRVFIGRMLSVTPQHKGWSPYAQLLIDLFTFMSPFLRNVELSKSITVLYKGVVRVMLVLLHDFPEFLCEFHYNFCDVIPPNCIQMRNLVLSAFPRSIPPPDPFTNKLQIELIPEINQSPSMQVNVAPLVQPASFKHELDQYLNTRTPVTFVTELRTTLQAQPEPGLTYNVRVINALVLYVGMRAIAHLQSRAVNVITRQTIAHSAHMDIFQSLAVDLDTEGRYLFLNAIANQLRYPNSHTNYFLNLILYLFAEANTQTIQEQITRVLLERLVANRPHPWGLLVTFIELIKNPCFKFWSYEFVHCASDIEKLFDNVALSCSVNPQTVAAVTTPTTAPAP